MQDFLTFIEIIIAIVLVIAVLMQVRGQGTGVFGSAQTTFRTRRGMERTLFRFTIVLAAVFAHAVIGHTPFKVAEISRSAFPGVDLFDVVRVRDLSGH